MRLKKAGFISDDRKFIKQPTPEQIEDALEAPASGDGGGIFGRLFGGES